MSIEIEHRNLEIRKTRNDFSFQVRNILLPLILKVLRHKERDTHSFYSGFVIRPSSGATPAQGLREQAKVNRLLPRQVSTLLTDFFKIPQILWAHALPVHDAIHIHWSTFLSVFYFDICEQHILPAREWTPVLKFENI